MLEFWIRHKWENVHFRCSFYACEQVLAARCDSPPLAGSTTLQFLSDCAIPITLLVLRPSTCLLYIAPMPLQAVFHKA